MDDWTRDGAGERARDDNEMKRDDGYVKNTNKGPRAGWERDHNILQQETIRIILARGLHKTYLNFFSLKMSDEDYDNCKRFHNVQPLTIWHSLYI